MPSNFNKAKEKHRITKFQGVAKLAVDIIQRQYLRWKQRQFLVTLTLRLPANSMSPISTEWVAAPRFLTETSRLLRQIFHRWRVSAFSYAIDIFLFDLFISFSFQCYKYRKRFDQIARNRMREKLTASLIFKNRKLSYTLR